MSVVRQIDEDEKLLKLIAHGAAQQAGQGECPSDEKIAAFLDDNLPKQERDALMHHLAECPVCRTIMRESRQTGDEIAESMARKRRVLMQFALPLAAAAMVLLFFSVKFGFWMQMSERKGPELSRKEAGQLPTTETKTDVTAPSMLREYAPPKTADIAKALASRIGSIQAASADVRIVGYKEYGFAGGMNRDRHSFRTGLLLMDLDVVLRADDLDKTEQIIKGLIGEVRSLSKEHQAEKLLSRMADDLARQKKPSLLIGLSNEVSASLEQLPLAPYVQFGAWIEGNRLATSNGSLQFLSPESLDYFGRLVRGGQLPHQVIASFDRLGEIQKRGDKSQKTLRDAKREMQSIIEVMQ